MFRFCLILLFSYFFCAQAQINYSKLRLKNDSLYTFAGHLYTGKAVFEKQLSPSDLVIIFGLTKGRINYHSIHYSEGGKVLLSAFYDDVKHTGNARDVSIIDTLNSDKTYNNEMVSSSLFVHPTGCTHFWDTMIVPDVELKKEYYRNGQLKRKDSIYGKLLFCQEWDSTGVITRSKTSDYHFLDALFYTLRFGFDWHPKARPWLIFNHDENKNDSCFLRIYFEQNGGISSIAWRTDSAFRFSAQYRPKRNVPASVFTQYQGLCQFYRRNKLGKPKLVFSMAQGDFEILTPKQRDALFK